MRPDLGALRSLTAREIERALIRDGFVLDRQRGSHRLYFNPVDRRRVTLAYHHAGQTFAPKTLRAMIVDQASWSHDDLRRLRLIR